MNDGRVIASILLVLCLASDSLTAYDNVYHPLQEVHGFSARIGNTDTFAISTIDQWYQVGGMSQPVASFTEEYLDAETDGIRVLVDGAYDTKVNMVIRKADVGVNVQFEFAVTKNGVRVSNALKHTFSTATDFHILSASLMLDLQANDKIGIIVRNRTNTNDLVIDTAAIGVVRIGSLR